MGACFSCCSDPGIPDNDIWRHMPPPDKAETFLVQSCGMFSKDYNIYKGDEADEEHRYMWMNKEGDWWSGQARIDIENFHLKTDGEPNNPDDEKRGQVLWRSKFTDTPQFQQHLSWSKGCHERFLGFFDGYESDEDDYYYDQVSPNSSRLFNKFLIKFSCHTSVKIAPGKTNKGVNFRPGLDLTLRVFSKGTAVRKVTRHWVQERDPETNEVTGGHWNYNCHDREFVDWIEYKLVKDDICIAVWRCQGMEGRSSWDCPIFSATKDGDLNVQTKEGWDPLLGLMLAHLCATEYSPDNVKSDFSPDWPPHNHYRFGRSNRPNGMHWYAPEGDDRDPEIINASAYEGGISIDAAMFQAIPGYEREFHFTNPYWDVEEAEAEAAAAEAAAVAAEEAEKTPMPEIDWGDLASTAPPVSGAVLTKVPAHMETDPETGLLVFVPISFAELTPPDAVEDKVEDEIEVLIEDSDDEGSDDDEKD
eukprot:CAMPEP_0118672374 /NCGR_PEP_ID=MMETSP0785-20121206/22506_1 /TAXON_ID=91992 /ORGANISM="Bolidomonas pacifica, Strain CCMP 1866" /LENGTH=474 /DNA_ID=CAMNT_0006567331 /DNA_START=939 /DNA_END=2360 /DNA_ORIENTATION=-